MKLERKLDEMFRVLAAADPREAPPEVEVLLVRAFRARKQRRMAGWAAALGAIAALLLAGFFWKQPQTTERPPLLRAHLEVPDVPVPAKMKRAPRAVAVRRKAEDAPAFYALPGADPLESLESVAVVRVELPRAALRVVGLPFNEDREAERIQADVLIGPDGRARAVRFLE